MRREDFKEIIMSDFMKIQLVGLMIILTACKSPSNDKAIYTETNFTIKRDSLKRQKTTFQKDTIRINDRQFIQTLRDSTFNGLTSLNGDTIIKSENFYAHFCLLDIDENGYKDIRVFILANNPRECDNYLFDKNFKIFRKLENCYLDIHLIKGSKIYFSLSRYGLCDMCWESYLSRVDNFKLINLGYLKGYNASFEDQQKSSVFEIYKIFDSDNDDMKLIEKVPSFKYIKSNDDKWNFFENYWTKNYRKFER